MSIIEFLFRIFWFYELKMNSFGKVARKCCFVGKIFMLGSCMHSHSGLMWKGKILYEFLSIILGYNKFWWEKKTVR